MATVQFLRKQDKARCKERSLISKFWPTRASPETTKTTISNVTKIERSTRTQTSIPSNTTNSPVFSESKVSAEIVSIQESISLANKECPPPPHFHTYQ